MTLILVAANRDYSIVVADRRITQNGTSVDEEFNKLLIFVCDDARVTFSFTGLATYGDFNTMEWLGYNLRDIGEVKGTIQEILSELKTRLQDLFSDKAIPLQSLEIVVSGFQYSPSPTQFIITLSNIALNGRPSAEFKLYLFPSYDSPFVYVTGVETSFAQNIRERLKDLIGEKLPHRNLLRFSIKHMQNAAKSNSASNLVGEQLSSVFIDSRVDTTILTTYHSADFSGFYFQPSFILTRGIFTLGSVVSSGSLLSGPDIRKRDPCWCGSGLAFKSCHMKNYGAAAIQASVFKVPMAPYMYYEEKSARLTGIKFAMSGGFG